MVNRIAGPSTRHVKWPVLVALLLAVALVPITRAQPPEAFRPEWRKIGRYVVEIEVDPELVPLDVVLLDALLRSDFVLSSALQNARRAQAEYAERQAKARRAEEAPDAAAAAGDDSRETASPGDAPAETEPDERAPARQLLRFSSLKVATPQTPGLFVVQFDIEMNAASREALNLQRYFESGTIGAIAGVIHQRQQQNLMQVQEEIAKEEARLDRLQREVAQQHHRRAVMGLLGPSSEQLHALLQQLLGERESAAARLDGLRARQQVLNEHLAIAEAEVDQQRRIEQEAGALQREVRLLEARLDELRQRHAVLGNTEHANLMAQRIAEVEEALRKAQQQYDAVRSLAGGFNRELFHAIKQRLADTVTDIAEAEAYLARIEKESIPQLEAAARKHIEEPILAWQLAALEEEYRESRARLRELERQREHVELRSPRLNFFEVPLEP